MPISRKEAKRRHLIEGKDALEAGIIELLLKHPQKMFTFEEVLRKSKFEKNYKRRFSHPESIQDLPVTFKRIFRGLIHRGVIEEVVINKDEGISYFGLAEKWH